MRILFTRFPLESAHGGAEIQTLSLMEGLRAKGHEVSFLGSCPVLLEECKKRKIEALRLEIGPPPVTAWGAVTFLWRQFGMKRLVMKTLESMEKPDVICMLSLSEKLLLTKEAVKRGTRVLWIEHDRIGRWLTGNPWLPTLRKLSRRALTVTVSDLSCHLYLGMGWDPTKTIAIPNGIDLTRFSALPAASEGRGSDSSVHLGCVARLSPEKGIDVLIAAVKDMTGVSLTIVGAGREDSHLRKLIGGDERMKILPTVPDLGAFYRSLDVLVLPSRDHDPFGLVAAEAMAVGIPVIVTDACGIAGYLRNDTDAVIVRALDVQAMRQGIDRCKDAGFRLAIGAAGREMARTNFGLDTMVKRYELLLEQRV